MTGGGLVSRPSRSGQDERPWLSTVFGFTLRTTTIIGVRHGQSHEWNVIADPAGAVFKIMEMTAAQQPAGN